jgi:hypothetical protein
MTELEKLTTEIRRATDYQTNKRILREKIQTDLHVPYNGGLFKVTPELLAFVATYRYTAMYLEDTYGNPVEISRDEFRTLCEEHFQQVMNTWHQQHAELKRLRKI